MLDSLNKLISVFAALGASRIYLKRLASNDNSKQQVYLGSSFVALNLLPTGPVQEDANPDNKTFKASLKFFWLDESGKAVPAPHAQLILYPQYPEVRFSGFLKGCASSPSNLMRANPRPSSGRVLFFGVCPDERILGYLVAPDSSIAAEVEDSAKVKYLNEIFSEIVPSRGAADTKTLLLRALKSVHVAEYHPSRRLKPDGTLLSPYDAPNGGGYTLEALLNITPNGLSIPDYLGWELKSYKVQTFSASAASSRLTLMTPEPTAGFYKENGAAAFVNKFGRLTKPDVTYFTGTHRAGEKCTTSGLRMEVRGFDPENEKIIDTGGGIFLLDTNESVAAGWMFRDLFEHWKRKHAQAAYVPYIVRESVPKAYWFGKNISLGEGTEIIRFLRAVSSKCVFYDPGIKVTRDAGRERVKARSQFRILFKNLGTLYSNFKQVNLDSIS